MAARNSLDGDPVTARIAQEIDHSADLTTVVVTGEVDFAQMNRQIQSFLENRPTQRVLWDIRNGSLAKLSMDDMRRIITEALPHAHKRRGGRTAVVCARPVDFGLARMFELLCEAYHVPFEIHVFTDGQKALHWLNAIAASA